MVFNATFNNISVISWRSVLLLRETRVLIYYIIIIQRLRPTTHFEVFIIYIYIIIV
jgi:hypothetical protein